MKMLGLNPMEQEVIDLTNNIVRNGLIYFPEFCKVVHKKFREEDEELFRQNMFKVSQTKYMTIKYQIQIKGVWVLDCRFVTFYVCIAKYLNPLQK